MPIISDKHHNGNGLVTTKKANPSHGFGLKTVGGIVDKYNDTFDMAHTEREFSLVILMSNV
ncbi:GHKL domain-containing protein [Vagococcus sp. BWB3-3]|uniref:GHKL domain-containing protein n=1 Tax=Vagococcus allomyrinae TaxID=2794353 RepID=A0A940P2L7_9ENTE|nr:GHKL domain-containing protein [Vagococcus allomyrinae]